MENMDSVTVAEARDELREKAAKGETCPLCRQYVKVYRRKLNAGMARWLIRFHRATGGSCKWIHATHVKLDGEPVSEVGCEYSKLAHWALIEQHPEQVGLWRETPAGAKFVGNDSHVLSHAVVYDNRCLRLDGEPVCIVEVLGRKFNYFELMNERPPSNEPS